MVCCQHGLQIAEDDYIRASFSFSQAPFKNISQSEEHWQSTVEHSVENFCHLQIAVSLYAVFEPLKLLRGEKLTRHLEFFKGQE